MCQDEENCFSVSIFYEFNLDPEFHVERLQEIAEKGDEDLSNSAKRWLESLKSRGEL